MKHRIFSLLVTATLLLSPLLVSGTVVLYMDLREMTSVSDVVVHARVLESSVRSDYEGPITTRTRIEAIQILKGEEEFKGNRLWFDLIGGAKDGMQIRIPGTPTFEAGEEVILFLEKNSSDFAICGLQQGVFRVRPSTEGSTVSRDLSGTAYAQFGSRGEYSMRHDAPEGVKDYPMANLKEEIMMYLSSGQLGVKP